MRSSIHDPEASVHTAGEQPRAPEVRAVTPPHRGVFSRARMPKITPRWAAAALLALNLALGPEALAQQAESASRKAARVLAEEGLALFDQKDYAAALERFNQANTLLDVPTVDLFAARCLVELGRLVEASERYLEAINTPLAADAPQPLKDAQSEAQNERARLLPRLAALALTVEGGTEGATILLDGKPIEPSSAEQDRPVDPGTHRVEGKRAGATVTEEVTLAEGEKKTITLKLPMPTPPPPPFKEPESSGSWMRTAGIIGLGAGGAGLALWGITGGIALSQQSTLEENGCSNGRCPAWSKPGSYSGLRVASMVGLYSGLGLAAAGAVLVIAAPRPSKNTNSNARTSTSTSTNTKNARSGRAWIEPWIGVAAGGVRGEF